MGLLPQIKLINVISTCPRCTLLSLLHLLNRLGADFSLNLTGDRTRCVALRIAKWLRALCVSPSQTSPLSPERLVPEVSGSQWTSLTFPRANAIFRFYFNVIPSLLLNYKEIKEGNYLFHKYLRISQTDLFRKSLKQQFSPGSPQQTHLRKF